ncbi:MAG: sigma-70 family RNA polymerase sigma factor [Chloroflexi bacterium]|nr:MAG: sigma-70 family RNA polymerase sigma factor [Chloroflexota bacterium]
MRCPYSNWDYRTCASQKPPGRTVTELTAVKEIRGQERADQRDRNRSSRGVPNGTANYKGRSRRDDDCDRRSQRIRAWKRGRLHRIAINAAVSYRRKMKLREVGEVIRRMGRPEGPPDPQDQIERRDLAEALAKLPPKQAAAIVLRHYHGYTNRAIAQALGIPERTVASRLAIAKQRLRGMLSQSYGIQLDDEKPRPERGLAIAD